MQDLSIDIKTMPQAFRGYHLLLVITCDQTNFMIAVPLRDRTAQMVAEALIYRVIYLFGPPRQIICDEATEFSSAIIQAILCMLNFRLKVISPYNHGSSKCERQIQMISEIIMKHLWDKGQMWPLFTTTAPAFKPVFTNVYQYYGNSLISFTNIIDDLLLQLPILIKLKVQIPMSLFSIEMAPVPLDAETYLGEKREYTQIISETELIALTQNNYIPLMQAQISLCAKIGYMYYCEYAHLLKKCTEHTCMSAIYYDQGSNIKVKQCKTIVTFDTIPESKILDASDLLILSNLQKPWTI